MPKFGRREIWKSLGTSRRSDAEALHLKEAAYWAAAFTQAEHLTHFTLQPSAGQSLSRGEVATLARQFFSRAKVQLDLDARGPADIDEQEAENAVGELEWQLSTLRSWANPDAHRLVEEAKQQTLGNGSSGPTDELLAELLRRALVQLGSLQLAPSR